MRNLIFAVFLMVLLTACAGNVGTNNKSSVSGNKFTTVADAVRDQGGDSSGGGNMIRSPITGKFVLLDYMVAAPNTYINFVGQPGEPLNVIGSANDPGNYFPYDYTYLPYQNKVKALVNKRLDAWWNAEPKCMRYLSDHAQYGGYYLKPDIIQGGQIFIPEEMMAYLGPLEIRPVADYLYEISWHDVFISKEAYDQMDLYSQAGLFVHEAWRANRNAGQGCPMSNGKLFYPTDKEIQEWTAKIMFTDP